VLRVTGRGGFTIKISVNTDWQRPEFAEQEILDKRVVLRVRVTRGQLSRVLGAQKGWGEFSAAAGVVGTQ